MRALEPEVTNAVWESVKALLPEREVNHPMGGHRPRICDRLCFEGILVRLVTGCSWVTAEHLLGGVVSDTTLRARRDEWLDAGVFDAVVAEALAGYDRIVGLDLSEVSVDGSQHKAPSGGEGTGKTPATGPNQAGSGPSQPMPTVSRWVGPQMGPTVTTASCCHRRRLRRHIPPPPPRPTTGS